MFFQWYPLNSFQIYFIFNYHLTLPQAFLSLVWMTLGVSQMVSSHLLLASSIFFLCYIHSNLFYSCISSCYPQSPFNPCTLPHPICLKYLRDFRPGPVIVGLLQPCQSCLFFFPKCSSWSSCNLRGILSIFSSIVLSKCLVEIGIQ